MDNLAHDYNKNPTFMGQVRQLSELKPLWFASHILGSWAIIFLCFYIWTQVDSILWWPFLAFIVCTRQQALGLLVHDVAHFRFTKNVALGDLITNLTMAFPLLYNVQEYRKHHLNHHKYLNTELDSDWMQKVDRIEYATPLNHRKVITRMLYGMFGGGVYEMVRYTLFFYKKDLKKKSADTTTPVKTGLTPGRQMALFYLLLAPILILTGAWKIYLTMWLLPALTILMGLLELRSLTEHVGFIDDGTHYTKTRSVRTSWIEGFILNPHNAHFHLEHHMFPSVPFYNLPQLHQALCENGDFGQKAQIAETYFGFGPQSCMQQLKTDTLIIPKA